MVTDDLRSDRPGAQLVREDCELEPQWAEKCLGENALDRWCRRVKPDEHGRDDVSRHETQGPAPVDKVVYREQWCGHGQRDHPPNDDGKRRPRCGPLNPSNRDRPESPERKSGSADQPKGEHRDQGGGELLELQLGGTRCSSGGLGLKVQGRHSRTSMRSTACVSWVICRIRAATRPAGAYQRILSYCSSP